MTTLVYLSLLLAVTGVFAACVYGHSVPRSVSAMVYSYPRKLTWLWSAWLVAVAALLLPVMMERLEDRGSIEGTGADQVIAGVTSQNANQRDALTQSLQNIVPKDGHGPRIYTVDVTVQEHKQSPGMFAFENRDDWTEEDWEIFFEEMEHSGHPPLGPQGHGPQPPEGVRPPNAPPGNWQGPPMGPPPGN